MLGYEKSELDYLKLSQASKTLDLSTCRKTLRLALLGDSSAQYLTPLFKALLCKNSVRAEIFEADYDALEMEVYASASKLYAFNPDAILILGSVFALREKYHAFTDKEAFAKTRAEHAAVLWAALRERTPAAVIQANFVLPYERLFGNYDERVARSFSHSVSDLNRRLVERSRGFKDIFINDMDYLAAYYGRSRWHDEKMWVLCKAYCSFDLLPYAVQNVVDTLLALQGDGVKCLALDLDNTLWGGVIGDDGLDGIRLGHLGEGEAYLAFQHFLLELKKRGILLAACSKNDPENALLPFREHPETVLKEEDFAAFVANWGDKAENLKTIREALNISLGSIVFVDDNPFERNLVRSLLPEVIVPELPDDPARYVRCLTELNLFEAASFSELDADRTELYRVDGNRKLDEKRFATPEEYLKSIEMKITMKRFDPFHLPRVAQLLQRSNQFNLLTRRFNEAQCAAFMRDEKGCLPFYIKLRDKYGDNGLISIVVASVARDSMRIEEWVMSCRVLSRGVEQYAMNRLFHQAKERGVKIVHARYEPTDKNGMVKDFFARFGFRKKKESSEGAIDWELETDAYVPQPHFFETEEEGKAE